MLQSCPCVLSWVGNSFIGLYLVASPFRLFDIFRYLLFAGTYNNLFRLNMINAQLKQKKDVKLEMRGKA